MQGALFMGTQGYPEEVRTIVNQEQRWRIFGYSPKEKNHKGALEGRD